MPAPSYERYGLTSNPFRDLSSESLDDVELFHVNLGIDQTLDSIKEEVYAKENRAVVALVGLHGAGKTERLLLAQTEARQRKAFCVYFDLTTKTPWVLKGIALAIQKTANLGGFKQLFSAPRWYRDILALQKIKEAGYDPIKAGRAIGMALNANAPAVLLLNDLHNLAASRELERFAKVLQEISDVIRPGVMVMFGSFPAFMIQIAKEQPPLSSRINRTLILPRLTPEEAELLLAKKLLARRLVEGLDPLYPFDKEAVAKLNYTAFGNPRRLLELADIGIEYGVVHRAYRIDGETVRTALVERQIQGIDSIIDSAVEWSEERVHGPSIAPVPSPARPAVAPARERAKVGPAPPLELNDEPSGSRSSWPD